MLLLREFYLDFHFFVAILLKVNHRERLPSIGLGGEAWPTWGRGARLVCRTLDVGLDSFALSYQEERAFD